MEAMGTVFKCGNGWWLARLDDGRVVMCHYRQRDYRYPSSPQVGDAVVGIPEKTERGWRLVRWQVANPQRKISPAEEAVLNQIDEVERALNQVTRYTAYATEFEAWRHLGVSSGLVPVCPQCGAEVGPQIELVDHASWGGRAEWRATYHWTVCCSCGWQEQFETVRERGLVEEPPSPDEYRPATRHYTETEWVKGNPSLQWRVRHQQRVTELRDALKTLCAELYRLRYGEAHNG